VSDTILLVDDQPEVRDYVSKILTKKGYSVEAEGSPDGALDKFKRMAEDLALVILDLDLGTGVMSGLEVLEKMKEEQPQVPVIILTGKGTIETAVKALKLGAQDYLEKDIYIGERLEASLASVAKILEILEENRKLKRENRTLKRTATIYHGALQEKYRPVGSSPPFLGVLDKARALSSIPRPVLIRGERGTGKELIAATMHYSGVRRKKPFITVNCAAFSGNLLETEMFGHEKGAFTGADRLKLGRFELADGGTLFLDEIGTMSPEFQEKMLRVLEYQTFERVGGTRPIEVDVRVIAATNADLEAMMEKGGFRRDLYDRLAFETLELPPMRERREDIPLLVDHFAKRFAAEIAMPMKSFTEAATRALASYAWPGNVRELRNVVERLVYSTQGDVVEERNLPPEIRHGPAKPMGGGLGGSFIDRVEGMERDLLERALSEAGGNQKKAATLLNLTYHQFRHYYKKHGLKSGAGAGAGAGVGEGAAGEEGGEGEG